jgi:hypothetical protein
MIAAGTQTSAPPMPGIIDNTVITVPRPRRIERTVDIEPPDKLTDPRIVAKVKAHFGFDR